MAVGEEVKRAGRIIRLSTSADGQVHPGVEEVEVRARRSLISIDQAEQNLEGETTDSWVREGQALATWDEGANQGRVGGEDGQGAGGSLEEGAEGGVLYQQA